MKTVFISFLLLFALCVGANAQKIETSYWNCVFGDSFDHVVEELQNQSLDPIIAEDGVYMKTKRVYDVDFATVGMKFTEAGQFYNIFAYNKYTSKKEANSAFDASLDAIRSLYPNVQPMSKSNNCLRLYAYTDDGHENVFSLGLYKGNDNVFFVRLNIYSDYLIRQNR